jgi:hypothetical protein
MLYVESCCSPANQTSGRGWDNLCHLDAIFVIHLACPTLYFRVTRPPWLPVEGSANNPANQIERLALFGWLWEPHHAIYVSNATTDDKAGIDKRQWAISGNDPEMEMHRGNLRRFLFQSWLRRLYLDAICWLNTEGNNKYDVNRMDV